jgi:hypothetical protein
MTQATIFFGMFVSVGVLIAVAGAIKAAQTLTTQPSNPDILAVTLGLGPNLARYESGLVSLVELSIGLAIVADPSGLLSSVFACVLGLSYVTLLLVNWRRPISAGCGCMGSRRNQRRRKGPNLVAASVLIRACWIAITGAIAIRVTMGESFQIKGSGLIIGILIGAVLIAIMSPDIVRLRSCGRPILFARSDRLRRTWASTGFRNLGLQQEGAPLPKPAEQWRDGCSDYFVFTTGVEGQLAIFGVTDLGIRSSLVQLSDIPGESSQLVI